MAAVKNGDHSRSWYRNRATNVRMNRHSKWERAQRGRMFNAVFFARIGVRYPL